MSLKFHCPSCNAVLSVGEEDFGKQVQCVRCRQTCRAPRTPEATAVQATMPAPKPAADAVAAVTSTGPRKPRSDQEEDDWPPRIRRDAEPSSFSPVWIILIVVGVMFGGVFVLMCVGFVGGLFFGIAQEVAMPPGVVAMEVEAQNEVMVAPLPMKEDKRIEEARLPMVAPRDAVVRGFVRLRGKVPDPKPDPRMAQHPDAKCCLGGPAQHRVDQVWMVGKDNTLANVVVSLAPPPGKKFALDEELNALSKKTVTIDQPFCAFEPHVVALWPEAQGLVFQNSAEINHNVKVQGGAKLRNIDLILPAKAKNAPASATEAFFFKDGGETIIDASCSIHTWMNAKIALFPHPYCAVTRDDGSFEIRNVPIGEVLTVYLWHESNPAKIEVQKFRAVKGPNELMLVYPAGN
jgi:hypothetical protein